jgi:4-hydroxy-3-polyprenylbenzoate decarboxylase
MSFVKHAIFVGENAPELEHHQEITEHILNRLTPSKVLITQGIIDALDHTAPESLVGGKMGIDATGDVVSEGVLEPLSDGELLAKFRAIDGNVEGLKQYFTHTKNPITVITVHKTASVMGDIDKVFHLAPHIKVLVVVDQANNDIDNPYMLLWRTANNIDAQRDILLTPFIIVDATNKNTLDGFEREWPGDTLCTESVIKSLQERGLIDVDEVFLRKFGILGWE